MSTSVWIVRGPEWSFRLPLGTIPRVLLPMGFSLPANRIVSAERLRTHALAPYTGRKSVTTGNRLHIPKLGTFISPPSKPLQRVSRWQKVVLTKQFWSVAALETRGKTYSTYSSFPMNRRIRRTRVHIVPKHEERLTHTDTVDASPRAKHAPIVTPPPVAMFRWLLVL